MSQSLVNTQDQGTSEQTLTSSACSNFLFKSPERFFVQPSLDFPFFDQLRQRNYTLIPNYRASGMAKALVLSIYGR